jgi:hypothetical protein
MPLLISSLTQKRNNRNIFLKKLSFLIHMAPSSSNMYALLLLYTEIAYIHIEDVRQVVLDWYISTVPIQGRERLKNKEVR